MSRTKITLRAGAVVVMGVLGLFKPSEASTTLCPENCLAYCPGNPIDWCAHHNGCSTSYTACVTTGCGGVGYDFICGKPIE